MTMVVVVVVVLVLVVVVTMMTMTTLATYFRTHIHFDLNLSAQRWSTTTSPVAALVSD